MPFGPTVTSPCSVPSQTMRGRSTTRPSRDRSQANREIGRQAGGLILGGLIDTGLEVGDNPRKSDMKAEDGCWDRPPLNDLVPAAHLLVRWQTL